ncbi:MAG: rhodanese-like domain-containing protein [Vicingaceae bacterium]|nr:rhodanese-like domain-containing protein [Vicingaceae bacterium]
MKKISLILTILFIVSTVKSVGQTTEEQTKTTGVFNINVTQFKKLVDSKKGLVLDVRTPEEWADGTIANAQKINYYDNNFAEKIEYLDKNTPVLIYCKKGGRSSSAAEILKEKGFKKVFNLMGGITAWIDKGYKIEK